MRFIETKGSWRQMGRQYGEACLAELPGCIDRCTGKLTRNPTLYTRALESLQRVLESHTPELLEETAGMSEASGIPIDTLLGYRFYNELRERMVEGCSVIFMADGEEGPLLGRNCDISELDAAIQVCRVCRPTNGPASMIVTYLGLSSSSGFNEHGLGLGGASGQSDACGDHDGLPGGALLHLLLNRCRSVADARDLMDRHRFVGKPMNILAGDDRGDSVLFELIPGKKPSGIPRRQNLAWQACTDFFLSGMTSVKAQPCQMQSRYARYGRIVHQLGEGHVAATRNGLQRLLTEVAQPGLCIAESHMPTAYSMIMVLKDRSMHLSDGHPAKTEYVKTSL